VDKRIEERTEYIVDVDRYGGPVKVFFRKEGNASAFLRVLDTVNRCYALHAGDIKKGTGPLDDRWHFHHDYGRDSTDYVTVHGCMFTPREIEVANERRGQILMGSSVDDFTLALDRLIFECHCPSER